MNIWKRSNKNGRGNSGYGQKKLNLKKWVSHDEIRKPLEKLNLTKFLNKTDIAIKIWDKALEINKTNEY